MLNLKRDFGTTAGRRMAVLKLDVSPVLPSEQAHGNSGTARVFRGKINHREKSHKALDRRAGREYNVNAYFN